MTRQYMTPMIVNQIDLVCTFYIYVGIFYLTYLPPLKDQTVCIRSGHGHGHSLSLTKYILWTSHNYKQ